MHWKQAIIERSINQSIDRWLHQSPWIKDLIMHIQSRIIIFQAKIVRSHIVEEGNEFQWGRWTPKRVNCEILYRLGRRTKKLFIRAWKPLPNRRVLKIFRGKSERESPKRTITSCCHYLYPRHYLYDLKLWKCLYRLSCRFLNSPNHKQVFGIFFPKRILKTVVPNDI